MEIKDVMAKTETNNSVKLTYMNICKMTAIRVHDS